VPKRRAASLGVSVMEARPQILYRLAEAKSRDQPMQGEHVPTGYTASVAAKVAIA
jgi:hypothetical protein